MALLLLQIVHVIYGRLVHTVTRGRKDTILVVLVEVLGGLTRRILQNLLLLISRYLHEEGLVVALDALSLVSDSLDLFLQFLLFGVELVCFLLQLADPCLQCRHVV